MDFAVECLEQVLVVELEESRLYFCLQLVDDRSDRLVYFRDCRMKLLGSLFLCSFNWCLLFYC